MRIFLKVREEFENSLNKGEEVIAGIPAYVMSTSISIFISSLPPFVTSILDYSSVVFTVSSPTCPMASSCVILPYLIRGESADDQSL